MLFNSWTFVVFFAVVLAVYHSTPHRWQNRLLLVANYVFYGAWDWRFLILLAVSTAFDWFTGLRIAAQENDVSRKRWVFFSALVNLTILGFFKYFNFFADSAVALLGAIGFQASHRTLEIILPVGLSFYTFQSLSYTIDIYRKRMEPIKNLHLYALYVSFFPQLVAGPIERAIHLLPQLTKPRKVSKDQCIQGLWLILWGFFKKMVVADNLAEVVNRTFASTGPVSGFEWLLAIYAFAFQIYGDFSGYTDIARGVAKLMGFELAWNFNLPYIARNPAEFWHRWHISLSTWLRDYLYIPLGGNRGGTLKTYRNLMVTMLLGGLWHGAAWNFIIWGAFHGALLSFHRAFSGKTAEGEPRPLLHPVELLKLAGMFHLTCLGWLFFRAGSVAQIGQSLQAIFTNFHVTSTALDMLFPVLFFPGLLCAFELWLRNAEDPRTRPGWNKGLGAVAVGVLILLIALMPPIENQSFLYFQF